MKPRDTDAETARVLLGYRTPRYEGFSAYAEGAATADLGGDFNDGIHADPRYPTESDPEDLRVNQLYAAFNRNETLQARAGRQAIKYDDQRFIGESPFRQNNRTFDAANLQAEPMAGLKTSYVYAWGSTGILGTRAPDAENRGDFHFLHAEYTGMHNITLSGFGYLLDFDRAEAAVSSQTYGAQIAWNTAAAGWQPLARAVYARQADFGTDPSHYDEPYYHLVAGMHDGAVELSGCLEVLGGDGHNAVQAPFGSKHPFNGWANKFTTTPAAGLQDYEASAVVPLPFPIDGAALSLTTQAHYFRSDRTAAHYGDEGDVGLDYVLAPSQTVGLELARYQADQLYRDTTRLWLYYEFKL